MNSRLIDEALKPSSESVAAVHVADKYGELIEGSTTRPRRLATPFGPWEKHLDWRSADSAASGLSTIHATIRFVEGAQGLHENSFVLEEADHGCIVDVLDGSLNVKQPEESATVIVAAASAATAAGRPNFHVLEDGDILRFHHGHGSYSQLGMIRVRIPKVNRPGGSGSGVGTAAAAVVAASATNASFVEQEQLFAEAISEETIAAIKRDNVANATQEKIDQLQDEIKEQRSEIQEQRSEIKELRSAREGDAKEIKELRAYMEFSMSVLLERLPKASASSAEGTGEGGASTAAV